MGFLTRFAICVGIVYWFAPEPTGYRAQYMMRHEREQAEAVLAALNGLSGRPGVSRDEIEKLAVSAGKALASLDAQTRRALIDHYLGSGVSDPANLKSLIN